ncbi:MAG: sigma-70 family RNA polymerase sigma factor [Proteobacteria bacterium]|nr:sigma-70 family RNA polymerase sigma factor [Pseudomonadota bacterium]
MTAWWPSPNSRTASRVSCGSIPWTLATPTTGRAGASRTSPTPGTPVASSRRCRPLPAPSGRRSTSKAPSGWCGSPSGTRRLGRHSKAIGEFRAGAYYFNGSRTGLRTSRVQGQAEELASALNARFRPALMAFFLRRIGNHAEAEDLTQDVLVRVTKHGAEIDASRPDAYVFQIAANLLRDRGRRHVVRANYMQSFEAASASDLEERDPQRVLQARQSLATVMRAVRELPERTRTVFILFRLEGMKQREIADHLGLSVRTVELHVIRASAHLRELLKGDQ